MTDSALRKFNDYLPYREDRDVLAFTDILEKGNRLEWFPESADANPSEETVSKPADYRPRLGVEISLNPDDNGKDCTFIRSLRSCVRNV